MRRFPVLLVAALLASCASTFTRVDFKYTSAAHMSFLDSQVTLDIPPQQLVSELSQAFRHHGGTVLERKELAYYFVENDDAKACQEAVISIVQKEFEAYRQNSFSAYQRIDRESPFTSRGLTTACEIFRQLPAEPGESWMMMVQFPPRSANTTIYRPTTSHFFAFSGLYNPPVQAFATTQRAENVAIEIATRLYIWAWRRGDGRTQVYLEGRPFSGQIEAAPGNSIGWGWWKIANGFEEANVVKSYLLLLEDHYGTNSE